VLIRIYNATDNVRCTCWGSPARFYDGDARVLHCCDCASFLAEKMIEMLARIYLEPISLTDTQGSPAFGITSVVPVIRKWHS
jgi:hypothetical protein